MEAASFAYPATSLRVMLARRLVLADLEASAKGRGAVVDALGGIVPAHALEPDTARAHRLRIKDSPRRIGLAPTRSRSARVRACGIRSNTPASPQRWNQRYSVPQGGK
ncbi:hypothetical protein VP06_25905 [Methylobacterium aquaticum]|jgi:hypothetical protein|uniref:Uncharacterized protein n=1 Tax=Methylobacterium aquaticum TaxID=270351 RepID=A0A0J6S696_9HYPH|nr:hypothetical protein VP06_25905 [Methylobacterium aquaticum]